MLLATLRFTVNHLFPVSITFPIHNTKPKHPTHKLVIYILMYGIDCLTKVLQPLCQNETRSEK